MPAPTHGCALPRFSVIVPVYKVQAYLHACLDSVLGQSFTDLELIAVDDCSPDACGALIDECAAQDTRVKAVHLKENVGLGRARNAGMEKVMKDSRMQPGTNPMPFDGKRMIFGGFEVLAEL